MNLEKKPPSSDSISRAPLSSDLSEMRPQLGQLLPLLEERPGWYGSIFLERKKNRNFSANFKQTQVSESISLGAVFRIYDGFALYEQATDELDPASLKRTAEELAGRVRSTPPLAEGLERPYRPVSWKVRISSSTLDKEITSQLPAELSAESPVHFGIRFRQDPIENLTPDLALRRLKEILDTCKRMAQEEGMTPEELTFATARLSFAEEESLFVDRETSMSQTLYRVALTIVTMSGADRTYLRMGGLGGVEAITPKPEQIRELLRDLRALKKAERMKPGRYRVIFGPALSGVLAHEAFGHSQEGDTCARGRSKAWELYQSRERVGNEHATILNNPALFEMGEEGFAAWGSYFFDEEGWLASSQIILDHGILNAPMTNLTSSLRLGVPRTANGKRESWANGVYTRQTNTYFSAGDRTLSELLEQMGDGYIALHPAGGMEDPKGMGIQVGISFLEEVRNGKRTGRLFKGPAGGDIQLTGYTPDVLNSILAKSKVEADSSAPDQAKHPWNDAGGCGKYHKEFVFAGCGGPYMLLDGVILG